MSRKGLSLEEKKAKMLELLHEKREFYQLKELEKLAPKEKGITVNSVKEVIQILVDDGSVDTDKIGGSIYFWAFPSKIVNNKKQKLDDLQSHLEMSAKRLKLVNKSLEESKVGKENCEDLTELQEIEKLQQLKEKLVSEVRKHIDSSSLNVDEMKKETQPVKDAANRWTDNIFAVKSWCKKKFMIEDKILNKQFGIPEDLDYIE